MEFYIFLLRIHRHKKDILINWLFPQNSHSNFHLIAFFFFSFIVYTKRPKITKKEPIKISLQPANIKNYNAMIINIECTMSINIKMKMRKTGY